MATFVNEILNEQLRPYEMSVWTLQDSFLAILKAPGIEVKGQIEEPKFNLKSDGTEELSFRVPMYYYKKDKYIENPFWFDKKYGLLLVGLRKIKVIFNKGTEAEEIYEFIISEVTEEHDKGQLYCEVSCNGMAFEELGRKGYKKSLTSKTYEYFVEDLEKEIFENAEKYNWSNEKLQEEEEKIPLNNINYWCDLLFENTDWTYSIQMNWFGYDGYALFKMGANSNVEDSSLVASRINNATEPYTYGGKINKAIINMPEPIIYIYNDNGDLQSRNNITLALIDTARIDHTRLGLLGVETEATHYDDLTISEQRAVNAYREKVGLRRYDKIYEDDYVSSWDYQNDRLVPMAYEAKREKCRSIDEENSNIYNITQTIAETFGVFCRYKYSYDSNYHIIKKEVIFYNTFLDEQEGQIDITYPYDTIKITRTMDSSDVCTKLYVNSVDDSGSNSGKLSITNCAANKTREDYLLNFDYLYQTNAITQEQYDYIPIFEARMFEINTQLEPIMDNIMNMQQSLNDREAEQAFLEKQQIEIAEQDAYVDKALIALANSDNYKGTDGEDLVNDGVITKKLRIFSLYLQDKSQDLYNIHFTDKGIIKDSIKIYSDSKGTIQVSTAGLEWEYDEELSGTSEEYTYVSGINNIKKINNEGYYYITYNYVPQVYYRQIKQMLNDMSNNNAQHINEIKKEIENLNDTITALEETRDNLLKEKEKLRVDFELMMGPAIREGNWTPEEFGNYVSKYYDPIEFNGKANNVIKESSLLSLIFDEKKFDGDTEIFWEEGLNLQKEYYPIIILNKYINKIKEWDEEELNKFQFTFISFNKSEEAQDDINQNIEDMGGEGSEAHNTESEDIVEEYFVINSDMEIIFLKDLDTNELLICGCLTGFDKLGYNITSFEGRNPRLERFFIGRMENGVLLEGETLSAFRENNIPISENDIILSFDDTKYKQVYPRLKIDSLALKTEESNIQVNIVSAENNNILLEKYTDYSILVRQEIVREEINTETGEINIEREDAFFITPKGAVFLRLGTDNNFKINSATFWVKYEISNSELNVYLDALNVLNTNAYPKVSYTVEVNPFNKKFIKVAYNQLGRVTHINDWELKFENVRGYISELELDLDKPWDDQITIQNYKTKFEDIFGRIMATTQEMISKGDIYNRAAMAFGSNGIITTANLQAALDRNDLNYDFLNGKLIIDENNGIQGLSDDGVVSFTDKGIQTAVRKDENGNWEWHTAITPDGVNADLITAGQINTDLIKIYSGDNLHFQMNSEGLYAYKEIISEEDIAEYVVFNEDGLALVDVNRPRTVDDDGNITSSNGDIKRVSIDWDGISIRNLNNEKVFYADDNGNLIISGTIKAANGIIGGWDINEYGLTSTNKYNLQLTAGIASGPLSDNSNIIADNVYKVFWAGADLAGNSNFYVDSNGNAFASSLVVNNSLVAKNITLDGIPLNKVLPEIREAEDGIAITALDGYTFNITSDGNLDKENLQFILTGHNIDELNENKVKFFIHDSSYEEPEIDESDDGNNDDTDMSDEEEIDDSDELSDEIEYNWREMTENEKQYISFYLSFQYLTFSINYGIIQMKNVDTIYLKVEYEGYEEIFSINLNAVSNFIIVKIFTIGGNYFKNGRNEDNENKIILHANVYKNGKLDTNIDNYIYNWYIQENIDGEIKNNLIETSENERADELIVTAANLYNVSKTNTYTCEVIERE